MRKKELAAPHWFEAKNQVTAIFFIVMIFCLVAARHVTGETVFDRTMPQAIPSEIASDWKAKDNPDPLNYSAAIEKIKASLPDSLQEKVIAGNGEAAYLSACHWRRVYRIESHAAVLQKILYARHHDIGGTIVGFTEEMKSDPFTSGLGNYGNQGSISRGGDYAPGGAILTLEMKNFYPSPSVLLQDNVGCIRDPCVSFDGEKAVFAWSKNNDGYHIYEMDVGNPTKAPMQLTDNPPGLKVSDFEPCYLPNGDILFNSSRCFGYVDCNFNITSNLYIMNDHGKFLRRVGFDQLHTFYPTVMSDGRVLYSRWEYNDRNILTCFGLFYMYIDGTHQTEYFGNQTSWPATIPQGREIPNSSGKILAITAGHMGPYAGDLIVIDPTKGRNGLNSVQLVAPIRPNPTKIDWYHGVADSAKLFQNPYPLDENWFIISYRINLNSKFRIYLMNINGERELLAWDNAQSVSQAQSFMPRSKPPSTSCNVDYRKSMGEVRMVNAYVGDGVGCAIDAGSIKKIRVIALEYHTDPSFGEAGSKGYTMTPVGRWTASWMAKKVLGESLVESDGSAAFKVPACTPVYFQLIDDNGCAIQSMRSWLTLQPGETFDCFGCHENKNNSPATAIGRAIATKPVDLEPACGLKDTFFHYSDQIQPILDEKCVSCHQPGKSAGAKLDLTGTKIWTGDLKDDPDNVNACRFWCKSYYNLTKPNTYVSYIDVNSPAEGLKPNSVGSVNSKLIAVLNDPPPGMNNLLSPQEKGKLCMWIDLCIPHSGFYTDDMKPEDADKYRLRLERRTQAALVDSQNIKEFIAAGQYNMYPNSIGGRYVSMERKSIATRFSASLSGSGRRIFVRVPCSGILTLRDMLGRMIVAREITQTTEGNIMIGKTLPKGIYIATFKAGASIDHQIISGF